MFSASSLRVVIASIALPKTAALMCKIIAGRYVFPSIETEMARREAEVMVVVSNIAGLIRANAAQIHIAETSVSAIRSDGRPLGLSGRGTYAVMVIARSVAEIVSTANVV